MKPLFKIVIVLLLVVGALVVFFHLTTIQSTPAAVEITLPESQPTKIIRKSKFITLILDGERVYQYESTAQRGSFLLDSNAVSNFLEQLVKQHGDSVAIIIKPLKSATYASTVAILDHMTIHKIKNFSMESPNSDDIKLAAKQD